MSFFKKIFGKKEEPIKDYSDFWNWFRNNEKAFHQTVKSRGDIEKDFFNKLSPKLDELKSGYFFLTGMLDDNTVELVLTADGNTSNIVFVEELVASAPEIPGWMFTSLKPPLDVNNIAIEMAGHKFNSETVSFYFNENTDYPDEIDIAVVHPDITPENRNQVANGVYIYLENILGELDFVNNIDNLKIIAADEAQKELISITKLKDFLNWRQKEFIEKYDGVRYDTENDGHSILEAQLQNGNMLIATINTELLNWDRKASHPWVASFVIKYDGSGNNGMPSNADYEALNNIEDRVVAQLPDNEGYLNIGRETSEGEREVYFACKDFRKPSKIFFEVQKQYGSAFEIEYEIYKDKYWRTFERFNRQ